VQILDEALKEEFKDEEEKQADVGKTFNETAKSSEATQETVIIISQKRSNRTAEAAAAANATASAMEGRTGSDELDSGGDHDDDDDDDDGAGAPAAAAKAAKAASERGKIDLKVETDVDRIIDSHDNEYVLSRPNEEGSMGLNLDPQFVRDLGVLITASAAAGLVMEALGQPTINGYFIAGSMIGPGGLGWIKEIVQVQSVAQLGVQLLLFTLGLEFSPAKLRAVRGVAVLGGLLQVALAACVAGAAAGSIGASAPQGAFLGALLAMSSTSVVVKCLQEARAAHLQHGQITIGTLILQDCIVGLLFALMPVVSHISSPDGPSSSAVALFGVGGRLGSRLLAAFAVAAIAARLVLPLLTRRLARFSPETFLLCTVSFCLMAALGTVRLGVSAELGAFLAGVALSATDQQETALHCVEGVSRFFQALFISSTGLVMSPRFLLHHLPVLAAGVMVVVSAKALLIAAVVLIFRYPADVAVAVGVNLAQVGEFAFVLLSLSYSEYGIIGSQHLYLLLMGGS
jgi:Kef-type K+ transport system membrane component KefB